MSAVVLDGLRWEVRERGHGQPLLLLHGFTGRGSGWGVHATAFARQFRVIVVDLPGHGRTRPSDPVRGVRPARVSVERTADDLATILARADATPAHVLGYSLGARIALRLAIVHPEGVRRLVLESPSAGIAAPEERAARRVADAALADRLERDGMETFDDAWERQPIFAGHAAMPAPRATRHPAARLRAARLRAERLSNTPAGLALSLRGAGQGSMKPLHDRLASVRIPTLVIAGALDPIGLARAEIVAAYVPGARLEIAPGAGHMPHLESPARFRSLTLDFLQEEPTA